MEKISFAVPIAMFIFYNLKLILKKHKLSYWKYLFFAMYPYLYENFSYGTNFYYKLFHVLTIILIVSEILKIIINKKKIILAKPFNYYIIFLAYILATGIILNPSRDFYIGIRNAVVFSIAIFLLYHDGFETINDFKEIARVNLCILFLLGTIECFSVRGRIIWYRVSACMENPNTYATVILLMLYFATDRIWRKKDFKYYLMAVAAIIFSVSEAGIIGLAIWTICLPKFQGKHLKVILWGSIGALVGLILVRITKPDIYCTLFVRNGDRMVIWAMYLNVFLKHSIFGTGFNTAFMELKDNLYMLPLTNITAQVIYEGVRTGGREVAHNDFIKIMTEAGVIGITILMCFMVAMFYNAFLQKEKKHARIILIGFVLFFVHNFFQEYHYFFYFFIPLLFKGKGCKNSTI